MLEKWYPDLDLLKNVIVAVLSRTWSSCLFEQTLVTISLPVLLFIEHAVSKP